MANVEGDGGVCLPCDVYKSTVRRFWLFSVLYIFVSFCLMYLVARVSVTTTVCLLLPTVFRPLKTVDLACVVNRYEWDRRIHRKSLPKPSLKADELMRLGSTRTGSIVFRRSFGITRSISRIRSGMGAYAGAARRRVQLATVLLRPLSGHRPGRRQPVEIRESGPCREGAHTRHGCVRWSPIWRILSGGHWIID